MNNEINIVQPKTLRSIDELVTAKDFDNLMDYSLTSIQTIPLIMPEANVDALQKAGIRLEIVDIFALPEKEQVQLLRESATGYAFTFAKEPWNEISRCKTTGRFFPDQPGIPCACCGIHTVEAYPLGETMEYIAEELARPNARLMLVRDNDKVVGGAWGYTYKNPREFVNDKYPTEVRDAILAAMERVNITEEFFYMSESFILPSEDEQGNLRYRGKGILNAFYQMFVSSAQELGLPMIGRTTADSQQVNKALQNFGFELIFGPQVIEEPSRRELRVLEQTYVTGIDTQNPKRVLYALGGR